MPSKPSKQDMPKWAREFFASYKPPTPAELRQRKRALQEALKLRERLDIRPLSVVDLIHEMRDERDDRLISNLQADQ